MSQANKAATASPKQMRAFLSHSSVDTPFVSVVSRQLGRARVRFDLWEFKGGTDLTEAIRSALATSGLFVFFASQPSIESLWAKFEIHEAEELLRSEVLKSAVALIVDDKTRPADLPKWMQRALIESVISPSAARRLIEYHLNRLRGIEPQSLFIGRESLLAEFSERLIPAAESIPPRLLILGGLPGIGRKTFLERALGDFLSLRMGPVLTLQPTDGLDALHLALLDELGALDTKNQIATAIEHFQLSKLADKAKTVAQLLASSGLGNVAPVIVDQGSLIDSSGKYTVEALSLFEALKEFPDTIVGLVHTRRPIIGDSELQKSNGIYTRVPPLDPDATKLLLNQMLRRAGIQAVSEQIAELARYLEGYPPAVNLAVSLAKEYGFATVMADKSGLVDFQFRTFASVIEKLNLSESEWKILRVLASEPVLPFETLVAILGESEPVTATALRRLIDLNLVLPCGANFQIAFPVKFAVQSLRGRLSSAEFARVAHHLKSTFWDPSDRIPPFEVIQATIHAVLRSDQSDLTDFKGFVLPSMLFRAAKESYDRGGHEAWQRSRKLLGELLQMSPQHKKGLILLCKAQVRLSEWKEAEKTLSAMRAGKFPEQHFLQGFLLWKRREFAKAVTAFRTALSLGQTSVEVYHGLATCLFRLNNLSEGEKVIEAGLRGRRPNSLLLDLAAQISIARGNFVAAESYVDKLRRVRADADYHHRLATLLNAKKQFSKALAHAEIAVKGARRRFEVEATLVDTLIEVGQFARARELLDALDNREQFDPGHRDVRVGLRCKLYLREKKWKDAEQIWNELTEKTSPVHLGLKQEILQQKIDDLTTSPGARVEAQKELEKLKKGEKTDQISLFTPPEAESVPDEEDEDDTSA